MFWNKKNKDALYIVKIGDKFIVAEKDYYGKWQYFDNTDGNFLRMWHSSNYAARSNYAAIYCGFDNHEAARDFAEIIKSTRNPNIVETIA